LPRLSLGVSSLSCPTPNKVRGVPGVDDRRVIPGIIHVIRCAYTLFGTMCIAATVIFRM